MSVGGLSARSMMRSRCGYPLPMRWTLLTALLGMAFLMGGCTSDSTPDESAEETLGPDYASLGLATDSSISSIDQELILSGGPPKDGIPALTDPAFVPVGEAEFGPVTKGILIEIDGEQRYYPYGILGWHEIINDRIGDAPFAVTF